MMFFFDSIWCFFFDLIPFKRMWSISHPSDISYSELFLFKIWLNMLGLSGDLYTISVSSSDRWRCVIISALTFLVDVAVNAMTGVWKKLRNSDNCWYSCLKLSPTLSIPEGVKLDICWTVNGVKFDICWTVPEGVKFHLVCCITCTHDRKVTDWN